MTTAVAAVPVAKLTDVAGPVLVDNGKGFVRVSASMDLAPGTRVLVSKGGAARLAYSEGCELALVANSITTVAAADGCKADEQVAAQAGLVGGAVAGSAIAGVSSTVIAGVVFTGVAIGIGTAVGVRASKNARIDHPILGVSP